MCCYMARAAAVLVMLLPIAAVVGQDVGSYCLPRVTDAPSSEQCRNLGYFEALSWPLSQTELCRATCDDDVDEIVAPVVWARTLRWLALNDSCLEAPQQLRELVDEAAANSSSTELQGAHRVDWSAPLRIEKLMIRARTSLSLHFSSSVAFEAAIVRIHEVYGAALTDHRAAHVSDVSHHRAADVFVDDDSLTNSERLIRLASRYAPAGGVFSERHWPIRHHLPSFVVYSYRQNSAVSRQGLAAFHRLVNVYDALCRRERLSVASCSQLTVFVAYPIDLFLAVVPQLSAVKYTHARRQATLNHLRRGASSSGSVVAVPQIDVMTPFSYQLDHTAMVLDFVTFLISTDLVQLKYLSKKEAARLRAELARIQEERRALESMELKAAAVNRSNSTEAESPLNGSSSALEDTNESTAKVTAQRADTLKELRDREAKAGRVHSVREMLTLLIRNLEVESDVIDLGDELELSALAPEVLDALKQVARYYRFSGNEEITSWESIWGLACHALSAAWVVIVLWVVCLRAKSTA